MKDLAGNDISKLKGRKIRKVTYYLWHNTVSDDDFKSLDWIEIKFHDGSDIVLHYGIESNGIDIVDFNFDNELKKIETQFKDLATLIHENATLDVHWFPMLDTQIEYFKLIKNSNKDVNSIIIKFTEEHLIEISITEEGMNVDFFE